MVTLVESSMVSLLPLAISWPPLDTETVPPEIVSAPVIFSVPLTSRVAPSMPSPVELPAMVSVPPLSTVMVPPTILLVSSSVSRPLASTVMASLLVTLVPELSVSDPEITLMS